MARTWLLRSWRSTKVTRGWMRKYLEPDREPGMKMFEAEEHGGVWDDDNVPPEEASTPGLLAPSLSEEEVLAFLGRDAELQLAKQTGQGRRQVAGERNRNAE